MTQADKLLGKSWRYSGDVSWSDYGGKWFRHVGARAYHVIEFTNMDDACGRDNEGRDPYVCELSLVDLNALTPKDIKSALDSCGWDNMPKGDDLALAECVHSYGNRAPLWDLAGRNAHALVRAARSESTSLRRNSNALEAALARPVNALGSTAAEYMRGDFESAMSRGVYAGDPGARTMAKMHGISDHVIDDARPSDYLPYVMGYMAAMAGSSRDSHGENPADVAPEYFQGYDRGVRVRAGEVRAPSWIKTAA